jgi:hypothetical protein
MKQIAIRALKLGLVVSTAIGAAALFSTGMRAVLLDTYLLALGGVLSLALVRITRERMPAEGGSSFDDALRNLHRRVPDTGPLALASDLELSTLTEFHLHLRLCPLLREIAAYRLRVHHGVDLYAEPQRAAALVGAETWTLVRPDRPRPADRLAAGPPIAYLREVITELEAL